MDKTNIKNYHTYTSSFSGINDNGIGSARFWPTRKFHRLTSIPLINPEDSGLHEIVVKSLQEATYLADAISSSDNLKTKLDDELRSALRFRSADILEKAADALSSRYSDSAKSLRLQAHIIRNGQERTIYEQIADLDEEILFTVCGPVRTWLKKSKNTYYSALFALVNTELNRIIATVDRHHEESLAFLRDLVHSDLVLNPPPAITFCDLMFCGGEANLYPKHFAYFLPEDQGIKYASRRKTLVLSNIYRETYYNISVPFSRHIIPKLNSYNYTDTDLQLFLWLRGHDIAHGILLPYTDYKTMRCESIWLSMVIQEAIADVFGFLLSTSRPWTDVLPNANLDLASDIFLREMLRYLCRGYNDFPDAGAALIELSFLSENGFIDLNPVGPNLQTTPQRLYQGILEMSKLFSETALSNSVSGIQMILERYYYSSKVYDFIKQCGTCDAVLEYIQYNNIKDRWKSHESPLS